MLPPGITWTLGWAMLGLAASEHWSKAVGGAVFGVGLVLYGGAVAFRNWVAEGKD